MAEAQEESKKITITVKTPKEKQQIEIEEDSDIKRVRIAAVKNLTHGVITQILNTQSVTTFV